MQDIEIRRATQADIPVLLEFEQGVIEAERPYDSTLKHGKIQYYDLQKLITGDDSILLVAEKQGEIIGSGYALIKFSKPYYKHDQYAYLGFMFVKPDHRGQGIITLILDELKSWCLLKGIEEMRLEVYHDNLSAMKAYEKAGFKKNLIEMRKEA